MEIQKQVGIYSRYPPSEERLGEGGLRTLGQTKSDQGDVPLVSIVTVVRNAASTLQRCIDSVQHQSYGNVEHIVVDGESDDGTLELLEANRNTLDYYISEPDSGIYSAMNKGIRLAQGRYLAMINADDWLVPEGIQMLAVALSESGMDISIGHANVINAKGENIHRWKIGNFDDRILVSGMSFCHQALLAHKRCFESIGLFDEAFKISGDYSWVRRLFLAGMKAVFVEEPVVNFSFTGLTVTQRELWKDESKRMFRESFDFVSAKEADAFIEYVYRDGPIGFDLLAMLQRGRNDAQFMTSTSMYLLQRLIEAESQLIEEKLQRHVPIRADTARLLRRVVRKLLSYLRRTS